MIEDIYNWLEAAGTPILANKEQHELCIELIQEEVQELIDAVKRNDTEGIKDGCVDIIWVTLNHAYMFDISKEELLDKIDRVSFSNWTKFCATEAEAAKTVEMYALGTHPNKPGAKIDAYYSRFKNVWVVKRKSDNKILKSLEFQEP